MGYNKNHQNLNLAFNQMHTIKHVEGNVEGEKYEKNKE